MTGWANEDAEGPAMPVASFLLSQRAERGPVDPLERARLARNEPEGDPFDADERAAGLLARGVAPGMMSDLGRRLADTEAEAAAEREKIARGERVSARVRGMLERGQVGGLEASRMLDGDFGDVARAEQLERRAERMRRQVSEAMELMQRQPDGPADPLEAASRHAHQVFREVTRHRMTEAEAGRTERRPFASPGGVAVRSDQPVTCADCVKYGATPEQSYMIHADPDAPAGVRLPVAELTEADLAEFGREVGMPSRPPAGRAAAPESRGVIMRGGPILGVS